MEKNIFQSSFNDIPLGWTALGLGVKYLAQEVRHDPIDWVARFTVPPSGTPLKRWQRESWRSKEGEMDILLEADKLIIS